MMPRSTAHDALAPAAQAARWWVDGPIFSTDRRGERITSLAPGARPGALGTGTVLRAIAVFAFWAIFGFFALSRVAVPFPVPWVEEMSQQWWWYVIVGVGALMLAVLGTFGLYSTVLARFGQHRVAALVVGFPATLGVSVALLAHLRIFAVYLSDPPSGVPAWQLPDPEVTMIFAAVAVVVAVALLLAIPFVGAAARRAQRRIAHMRETGTRTTGTLKQRIFTHTQIGTLSQFETVVEVELPEGPVRVKAHMSTAPGRVPLVGEPLAVFFARRTVRGRVRTDCLIEPDDARPLRFESDSSQFTVASDGGGGG
ncbi:cytochrome b561 [Microbacterium ginsengiterrae]|uniref:Cytochrome b561 n=1 Tax=Microbacterium ginsengiterrae TaxID=546115 RepID=A0A7W9FDL3_9MICO|nr:hypothetical protein [Microbacterium ginsengiterrae]MBB5743638.1 cytochrome b561 [Microbacterium ginsengiterrae]